MVLIRKCNWNDNSLCGGCWQIFHSKTFLLAAKCENMKRRPIIEFSAFSLKTHNYCKSVQKLIQINLIQNTNRSNGKHGGYFHFRQWRGGEVLILHFHLSSKFVSTYKIYQMSVPLQIHTNPHYKTFSEANLPFQGLRGSINEVRHFSNQTNLLKTYWYFLNNNKTEFYFVSGSLESASTRLQPSYGSFQLGKEVKTRPKIGLKWCASCAISRS